VITNKTRIPIPLLVPLEKYQRKSLARYKFLIKIRGYEVTDFHAIRHSIATYLAQYAPIARLTLWGLQVILAQQFVDIYTMVSKNHPI